MSLFRVASLVLSCSLVAIACSTSDSTGLSTDEVVSGTAIPPTDWLACWVVPSADPSPTFFTADEIHCQGKVAPNDPLPFERAFVEVRSKKGSGTSMELGPTTEDTRIATIYREDFPVELFVKIVHGRAAREALALPSGFRQKATFATFDAASAAAPTIFRQPFALWALDFENRSGNPMLLQITSHPVDIAPWVDGLNFTIPDTGKSTVDVGVPLVRGDDGETVSLFAVAPKSGALSGTLYARSENMPVSITGPGRWRVTADGIERHAGNASPDAGTLVDDAGENDARVGPNCGNANEKCCSGNVCADGSFCFTSQPSSPSFNTCVVD